jgi:hypothetical protein
MGLLWLLIEAGALGLLVLLVAKLVRLSSRAVVQRAPLLADQILFIGKAGRFNLCLEGPPFATYGVKLQYALCEAATGRPVPITPVALGSNSNTFTRQRVTRAAFALPGAGSYRLVIGGLTPGRDYRDYAVVVARPFARALVGLIIGVVAAAFLAIGGLVIGLVALT